MKVITEGNNWRRIPEDLLSPMRRQISGRLPPLLGIGVSPFEDRSGVASSLCRLANAAAFIATLLVACCSPSESAPTSQGDSVVKLPVVAARDIRFRHLTIADGLSHSIVNHIVQDDQGFMWFGAQGGLNRYDGYRFKVYKHDPRNPNGLNGIFIRSLFKDRSGLLWIGVDQNLDKFDPATEAFTHYQTGSTVVHISQDRAGIIWLATSNGLERLDPTTGRITGYRHDPNDPASLSSNNVRSSGEDKEGTLWVATTLGLDAFDRRTGKVTTHVPLDQPSDVFFHEDRFGVFWIIYPNGSGLATLDRKTNKLTRYLLYDHEPPSTVAAGVAAILEDRDGTLWFGTHGNGLLKLDPNRQKFIRYRTSPGDLDSLSEDSQLALFEDHEGNMWVATPGSGIDRFVNKSFPFETFRHEPGNPNSLDRSEVNGIYEDNRGILWIGTEGGINRIDRKAGRFTLYRDAAQTSVITITGDGSKYLWVGAYGSGLKRFDTRTGEFKAYLHNPADPRSLSNNIVTHLFVDHAGTMWAETDDGLNRFDPVTERFTVYRLDPENPSRQSYLSIAEDQQGHLWLGCQYSGLQRFDPATGKFTVYEHDPAVPGSLSNNRVLSLHFDYSGTLWAGTQNGLDRFDPKTGTFTAYYERDGLPDDSVNAILENDNGDLWLSTNRGLSRFTLTTMTFKNFFAADGLPGDEFHLWGAAFKSRSGEMLFGGPNGATAFYPDRIIENSFVPPVVLTDFQLFAKPVSIGGKSPLQKSIGYTRSLTLSYWQNIFSFEFSALSYANAPMNRYRYKLEGLEKDWNEAASTNRSVAYTTLPPGNYTLRVQGATNRSPWNESGVALRIEVLPPWWSTWWFRVICVSSALVLFWELYQFRLRQIAQKFNMRMEERVGERTRIAQELHDTLLQGFLSASMHVHLAVDGLPADSAVKPGLTRALQLMGQVIEEGRNSVRGLRSSHNANLDLEQAFSSIQGELLPQKQPGEQINFRVIVDGERRPLNPLLRDEVYRIGREALINAFRHARAKSIEIEMKYSSSQLRLLVRDDGCGLDPEVISSGRDGHWGLSGMRERADRIGARLHVLSSAATGTEIELSIPGHVAFRDHPEPSLTWFGQRKHPPAGEGKPADGNNRKSK